MTFLSSRTANSGNNRKLLIIDRTYPIQRVSHYEKWKPYFPLPGFRTSCQLADIVIHTILYLWFLSKLKTMFIWHKQIETRNNVTNNTCIMIYTGWTLQRRWAHRWRKSYPRILQCMNRHYAHEALIFWKHKFGRCNKNIGHSAFLTHVGNIIDKVVMRKKTVMSKKLPWNPLMRAWKMKYMFTRNHTKAINRVW